MASRGRPHVSPPPDGARPAVRPSVESCPMSATPFDYGTWSRLLALVVTPEGKVDYEALAARRGLLDRLRRAPGLGEPGHRPRALPVRGPRARLLDQCLQRLRAARGDGGVPDPLGVEGEGRPVLRSPAPRRGRPRREPQRHRAPDPARAVRRAAHPLRDQLRVERLSADAPSGVRGRRHPRHARRGHAPVPRERVELPRRRGPAADLRLAALPDVRRGLRGRRRLDRGVPAGRARLRGRAHGAVAGRARRVRGGLQRVRLGAERRAPRPEPAARSPFTRAWRPSTRATPSCGSCTSTTAISATGPAPGARCSARRRAGTRRIPSGCSTRRRRPSPPTATSSSTEASPRSTSRGSSRPCATCGPRLPGALHDLLERRARAGADPRAGQRPQDRGGAELLHLPGPRRRALARARQDLLEAWGARIRCGSSPATRSSTAWAPPSAQTIDRDREAAYHAQSSCLLCFPVLRSTGDYHACPFAIENPAPHYHLGDLSTAPGRDQRELPPLPHLGPAHPRPRRPRPQPHELRDVPAPRNRAPHLPRHNGVTRKRPASGFWLSLGSPSRAVGRRVSVDSALGRLE